MNESAIEENSQSVQERVRFVTQGDIMVIFSPHAPGKEIASGKRMWPKEVYEILTGFRPTVIAVDSIPSYVIPSINQMVPVDELTKFPEDLRVLGADVPSLRMAEYAPSLNANAYKAIKAAVEKYDPDFSPTFDQNTAFNNMIRQEFALENGVVYAGEAALIARILRRIVESRQDKTVSLEGKHTPKKMSRREFLKLAGIGAGGAALGFGKQEAYYRSIARVQVTDGSPTLPQAIVRATKPLLYPGDNWANMRDAVVGLASMNELSGSNLSGARAAIIFGNGHTIDEYPGRKLGETPEQAKARLVGILRRGFVEIVENNRTGVNPVSPDTLKAALRNIFALYSISTPTMRNSGLNWEWQSSNNSPEVVKVIDEVVL